MYSDNLKLAPSRWPPRSAVSAALHHYFFPETRRRARGHLSRLRHEYLPNLRHRAQSRIYQYIVRRQLRRQSRKSPINLARQRAWPLGNRHVKDAGTGRWSKMTQPSALGGAYNRKDSWNVGRGEAEGDDAHGVDVCAGLRPAAAFDQARVESRGTGRKPVTFSPLRRRNSPIVVALNRP